MQNKQDKLKNNFKLHLNVTDFISNNQYSLAYPNYYVVVFDNQVL